MTLTSTGFVARRGSELLAYIRTAYETLTGLTIDWERDKFLGNVTAIMASLAAEISEEQQALYDAFTIANATGLQLDQLAAIVGVPRLEATHSTATVACFGDRGTIVAEERLLEDQLPNRWEVTELVQFGKGSEVLVKVASDGFDGTATYTITIDGNAVSADCVALGIASNAQLLQAFASIITGDATVGGLVAATTDDYDNDTVDDVLILASVGDVVRDVTVSATGTGELWLGANVEVQAVEIGEVTAGANAINTITTPVAGWEEATNPIAATPGRFEEGDDELRQRRQFALQQAGSASVNAIRANVLIQDGVSAVVVLENDTGATATIGGVSLLSHSIGAILYPNTLTDSQKEAVALAIYERLTAGIRTNGTDVVATVTGEDLSAKEIRWDWASSLSVDVAVTVTLDTGYTLTETIAAIKGLVADYFTTLGPGDSVRLLALYALIATVEGVLSAAVTLDGGSVDITPTSVQVAVAGTVTVS